ncbi:MAG: ROK family protein [Bacteroidales bacterium]|nr:ROK family protein [Bacteroidales bacterium]
MSRYIGIDLGGTIVKIGVVEGGEILALDRIDADSRAGLGRMLPAITRSIRSLISETGGGKVDGISLAFPGIVDFKAGKAAATNAKYNDAPSINLAEWSEREFEAPFIIDNDARMALIGEWQWGAGSGVDNMVMMTIGTGIGTGAVVDSRPLYGRNFCAGSLGGHMIVDYRGRKCTCGNIGCVEAHSSSFFLPQIIRENKAVDSEFTMDYTFCDFKALFDMYRAGNRNAEVIVRECMDVWSAAIVNYIHAYDPQIVVIGGGIMKSANTILPYIRKKVESLAWCPGDKVEIVASALGDDAAILASEYYFRKYE